jgi:excisionase family DNA binding protein
MSEKLLTPEQLAERWDVKKSQVYRLAREGRIPVVKIGKYYRFRVDAIERWENGTVDTKREAA